ncbi:similar to Saccharomyces cerevisiae YMR238W DFG5 Putative mannosidase [Maudiozyma barnettii]|uniref:Mannan endo-1,6-alpha-mannosidase n=1 Tax=Maudiozyma barnettii TaxID=61262 RepID=A0A8H2ZFU0_9SACH|nr:putative mannan endo-1,6-alpha-mannosidase [Kazachstania barnettii]CAB4252664.1 similar to Saccharomyces cerevisiae YMR238W DFG5 Putative mannosidase [Kazachstania barnettii]CAD1780454.1 similar to Saccharomyces cerevisiae YMR238W DFG5 Putative mannosidase [Kazachstania barnettii]
MTMIIRLWTAVIAALYCKISQAMDIDTSDATSICYNTALIQAGMLDYYEGNRYGGTVGMFQSPYYWWEAGESFGGMIENWFLCQNDTYLSLISEALLYQAGTSYNFIPDNQTMVEGNDDQGIWGLTVMDAVERNMTDPTGDNVPGWLSMAQAVFNTIWSRWDSANCGGGVRWQIFTWNSGYNYKNTISNACLFQLAARLGRYTGNDTYLEVADEVFTWLVDVGYVVLADTANVFDGADIADNCTDLTKLEWSYNHGVVLGGAAYMYNATNGTSQWETRVTQLLKGATTYFFQDGIMYEMACQDYKTCNNDQRSFKSIFSRMLGFTSVMAPFTAATIDPLIKTSAEGAARTCNGGSDGHTCGLNWQATTHDGYYGLGEQMCALEVMQTLLIHDRPAPYKANNGGASEGNANAGLDSLTTNVLKNELNIQQKDRAGAAIITAIILVALTGGAIWMLF